MMLVHDVLYNTGITATAGIGTNLFLAKAAMDIVAKKAKPDKDGVRIAALDGMSMRETLRTHRPLPDFCRIGGGAAARPEAMQLFTLDDVARASLDPVFEALRLLKEGGEYEEYVGKVRLIDTVDRTAVFLAANGRSAGNSTIASINSAA